MYKHKLAIYLVIGLLLGIGSCSPEEDEESIPQIEIIDPLDNANFIAGDTILVRFKVSDENYVSKVLFSLKGGDEVVQTMGVDIQKATDERSIGFPIENLKLPSGPYTLTGTAYNDKNRASDAVTIQVKEAIQTVEAYVLRVDSSKYDVVDANSSFRVQMPLNAEFFMVQSSLGRLIFSDKRSLYIYDYLNRRFVEQRQDVFKEDQLTDLRVSDIFLFAVTSSGQLIRINKHGDIKRYTYGAAQVRIFEKNYRRNEAFIVVEENAKFKLLSIDYNNPAQVLEELDLKGIPTNMQSANPNQAVISYKNEIRSKNLEFALLESGLISYTLGSSLRLINKQCLSPTYHWLVDDLNEIHYQRIRKGTSPNGTGIKTNGIATSPTFQGVFSLEGNTLVSYSAQLAKKEVLALSSPYTGLVIIHNFDFY